MPVKQKISQYLRSLREAAGQGRSFGRAKQTIFPGYYTRSQRAAYQYGSKVPRKAELAALYAAAGLGTAGAGYGAYRAGTRKVMDIDDIEKVGPFRYAQRYLAGAKLGAKGKVKGINLIRGKGVTLGDKGYRMGRRVHGGIQASKAGIKGKDIASLSPVERAAYYAHRYRRPAAAAGVGAVGYGGYRALKSKRSEKSMDPYDIEKRINLGAARQRILSQAGKILASARRAGGRAKGMAGTFHSGMKQASKRKGRPPYVSPYSSRLVRAGERTARYGPLVAAAAGITGGAALSRHLSLKASHGKRMFPPKIVGLRVNRERYKKSLTPQDIKKLDRAANIMRAMINIEENYNIRKILSPEVMDRLGELQKQEIRVR